MYAALETTVRQVMREWCVQAKAIVHVQCKYLHGPSHNIRQYNYWCMYCRMYTIKYCICRLTNKIALLQILLLHQWFPWSTSTVWATETFDIEGTHEASIDEVKWRADAAVRDVDCILPTDNSNLHRSIFSRHWLLEMICVIDFVQLQDICQEAQVYTG